MSAKCGGSGSLDKTEASKRGIREWAASGGWQYWSAETKERVSVRRRARRGDVLGESGGPER